MNKKFVYQVGNNKKVTIYAVFLHYICSSYLGHTLLLLTEFTVKQLRLFAKIVVIPSRLFNSVMHCFYIHITNTVIVFFTL